MSNPIWVKCPDCGWVSKSSDWIEADIFGCEDCGSHSGYRCPNPECYYGFDAVYSDFEKIGAPPSLLELIAVTVDEAEKADERNAQERAQAEAGRAEEEESQRRLEGGFGGFIFWRPSG